MGGVLGSVMSSVPTAVPKAATPQRVRVSQGVSQGLLVHKVQPQYPPLARQARIQGVVVLQALIGKDGTITNLHVVSGHPMLTNAALGSGEGVALQALLPERRAGGSGNHDQCELHIVGNRPFAIDGWVASKFQVDPRPDLHGRGQDGL